MDQADPRQLAYRHEDSLSIQSVSFEAYARFIINEDRSTNVSELIIRNRVVRRQGRRRSERAGGQRWASISAAYGSTTARRTSPT